MDRNFRVPGNLSSRGFPLTKFGLGERRGGGGAPYGPTPKGHVLGSRRCNGGRGGEVTIDAELFCSEGGTRCQLPVTIIGLHCRYTFWEYIHLSNIYRIDLYYIYVFVFVFVFFILLVSMMTEKEGGGAVWLNAVGLCREFVLKNNPRKLF